MMNPVIFGQSQAQNEQKIFALPPIATDARTSGIGSFVPIAPFQASQDCPLLPFGYLRQLQ